MFAVNVFAIDYARQVAVLTGSTGQVRSIVFSKDQGQVMTAGLDSFVRVWSLKTQQQEFSAGHGAMIECMACSPDGKYIATAGRDSTLKLWDAKTGNLLSAPQVQPGNILSLAFSPDSDFIAAGSTDSVNIWKTSDLKKPFRLDTGGSWAKTAAFSPDNKFFLAAGGNRISVWDVEYGDVLSAVTGKGGIKFGNKRDFDFGCMVFDAGFSPDSQYFSACGDDGTVKTWRVLDGLIAWEKPAHNGTALCLAFSGGFLATAGKDGMINFFDIKNGNAVFSVAGCRGQANAIAFSLDGKYIAASCADNSVTVWKLSHFEFGGLRAAFIITGFLFLAGITAVIISVFGKKISVRDWRL